MLSNVYLSDLRTSVVFNWFCFKTQILHCTSDPTQNQNCLLHMCMLNVYDKHAYNKLVHE